MRRPALLLVLGCWLGLAGCQAKVTRPTCPVGQVCIEYGNTSEPETLDPQKSSLLDEFSIINDLFTGLSTDSNQATPVPGMAKSWETSPDGLTWTFHLRDAKWSDGVPVTAGDFVYSYRRMLKPETAAIYAYLIYQLRNGVAISEGKAPAEALGAKAVDDHTLVLTLEHPIPYLPELLKHVSFFPVPKHAVEKWGDAWIQPEHFVSNGPYKLVSWQLGDYVRVAKNPQFYEADKVCIDRIDYYPTSDSIMAERRVKRGELDVNTSFQSNRITRLRSQIPDAVRTHVSLATSYIQLNGRDVPAFKDIRVRRALSESIDREFITDKLMRAGQIPAYAFIPPGTANYSRTAHTVWADLSFAQRQTQARQLLAAAGYGPAHPLEVEIKSANSPDTLLLMQAVQADWAAIGIKAKLVQNESQIAFTAYRARDFQIGSMSWYADYNDAMTFLGILKSDTGAQNYGDYNNPAYDALLVASDHEADLTKRAALLGKAEQMILDEEAIIPLFYVVNRALVTPKITGWVDNVARIHPARWMCVKP